MIPTFSVSFPIKMATPGGMAYTSPTYSFAPCRAAPFSVLKFDPLYPNNSDLTELNSKIEGETIDISLASDITFSGSAMKIGSMVSISGMVQKTSGYFAIKTHIILGNISYRPSTRITVPTIATGPSYACGLGNAFVESNGDIKIVIYEQGTTFNTTYISMTYKSD